MNDSVLKKINEENIIIKNKINILRKIELDKIINVGQLIDILQKIEQHNKEIDNNFIKKVEHEFYQEEY